MDFYNTLQPTTKGDFREQLSDLHRQLLDWLAGNALTPASLLQTRVYLTDAANQWQALRQHALYADLLSQGAVSYVEQPLLGGEKVGLQLWASDDATLRKEGTPERLRATVGGVTLWFHSVRFAADEVRGLDAEQQTERAFLLHKEWISSANLTLETNCHRTWLFVRDIDRHYAGVVRGRNRVFDNEGLTPATHFIASTGIGGYSDNAEAIVCVDFLTVEGLQRSDVKYLHAPAYLNPTHEYGVAFERGTALNLWGSRHCFISGTASIDCHGLCLHHGDVMRQADRLFLNIDQLLRDAGATLADMAYMIVYLRDVADCEPLVAELERRFPGVPRLVVAARVCRPEWLVEVECVALCRP